MLRSWPDPLMQERLEDAGFFFDPPHRTWVRFADEEEVDAIADYLKRHALKGVVQPATGRGQTVKHPRLADQLVLPDGGSPTVCALCGQSGVSCRRWLEGDDTDDTDYPNAAVFYMCGKCVQERMLPHPRLYAPVDEAL